MALAGGLSGVDCVLSRGADSCPGSRTMEPDENVNGITAAHVPSSAAADKGEGQNEEDEKH